MSPREAHARRTDVWTSHLAASKVHVTTQRARVYLILSELGPLSDEQLVAEHERRTVERGWPVASASGLRSRRAELVRDGLVRAFADEPARTALGSVTLRWEVSPDIPRGQAWQGVLW